MKWMEANAQNRCLTLEDLEDSWDPSSKTIITLWRMIEVGMYVRTDRKQYQLLKQ